MLIRSVLTLLGLVFLLQIHAQETVSANGGFAKTDRLSVSWTMGQPIQAYLQSSKGIYTVGYQQPNLTVTLLRPEGNIDNSWARVFPNPVKDQLFIRLNETLSEEKVSIQIFTVDGKPMKSLQSQGETDLEIDFNQFPAGTYLVKLDAKGKNQVYSIIKVQP